MKLIEQIIKGDAYDKVREYLLCNYDSLMLDQAIKIARMAYVGCTSYYSKNSRNLKRVPLAYKSTQTQNPTKPDYRKSNNHLDNKAYSNTIACKYCGLKHSGTSCPAAQSECRFCHTI